MDIDWCLLMTSLFWFCMVRIYAVLNSPEWLIVLYLVHCLAHYFTHYLFNTSVSLLILLTVGSGSTFTFEIIIW